MHPKSSSTTTTSFVFFGLALASMVDLASSQSCEVATALARTYLDQQTRTCLADCDSQSECAPFGCIDGGDSYGTSCNDACIHEWEGYKVQRATSASNGVGYLMGNILYINAVGIDHTFVEGAVGTFSYAFEPSLNDPTTLQPALGGGCTVIFNGVECPCEQRYCDDTNTLYGNVFDCSHVEGGSYFNPCFPGELTTESSLMEILFRVPTEVCNMVAISGNGPPASAGAGTDSSSNGGGGATTSTTESNGGGGATTSTTESTANSIGISKAVVWSSLIATLIPYLGMFC